MKICEVKNNVISNIFECDSIDGVVFPFDPKPYIEGKGIGDLYDDQTMTLEDLSKAIEELAAIIGGSENG